MDLQLYHHKTFNCLDMATRAKELAFWIYVESMQPHKFFSDLVLKSTIILYLSFIYEYDDGSKIIFVIS